MKNCYLFFIPFLLSSCATILNNRTVQMDITTSEPARVVHTNDTLHTVKNRLTINVLRQKEPVHLTIIGDSMTKSVDIDSKTSPVFLLNAYPPFWPGFWVDWKNPKRYTYPRSIHFDLSEGGSQVTSLGLPTGKGLWQLQLSLPYINSFLLRPEMESVKNNFGFMGIGVGLEYYYKERRFINLSASVAINFLLPFPAPIDYSGEVEMASTSFVSLTQNHKINRFSFGYGLTFGSNNWAWRYIDRFEPPPPTRAEAERSHEVLGLAFPVSFQRRKRFYFGMVYRPTFLRISTKKTFGYEHLISIDFGWKIRMGKRQYLFDD
jgi:hypothetical protein